MIFMVWLVKLMFMKVSKEVQKRRGKGQKSLKLQSYRKLNFEMVRRECYNFIQKRIIWIRGWWSSYSIYLIFELTIIRYLMSDKNFLKNFKLEEKRGQDISYMDVEIADVEYS